MISRLNKTVGASWAQKQGGGWREDNIQTKDQKFSVQLTRDVHPLRGNTFHYILSLILLQHTYTPNVLVKPVVLSPEIAQKLKKKEKGNLSTICDAETDEHFSGQVYSMHQSINVSHDARNQFFPNSAHNKTLQKDTSEVNTPA